MTLDLESAINKEEALAYSFGERYKRLGEPVGDLPELEAEHRQLAEWLKELKAYRNIIFELSEAMHWYDGCEKCQGFREYPTSDFVDDVRSWVKQFEEVNADE